MSVIKIVYEEKFAGLSSDDMLTDVNEGSTFHSVDTGEEWVFHDGIWTPDLRRINAIKMAALI